MTDADKLELKLIDFDSSCYKPFYEAYYNPESGNPYY